MMWVGMASAALAAYGSLKAGQQTQTFYNQHASQALVQGRAQSAQYERQANNALRASLEVQAAARARAAAGGIDPFSGSAQFVQDLSAKEGLEDFRILSDSAELARLGGVSESSNLRDAGRYARSRGLLGAVTAIGEGVYRYGQLGGPPKKK